MTYKVTIELADPVIVVPTGKDTNLFVHVDVRKINADVMAELLRQGVIKPLTDISKDKDKEESWQDVHERRRKRVENWYNGDFSVRGGGVQDPVAAQMREEIVMTYVKAGVPRTTAQKHVKGTAAQFLKAQGDAKLKDGDFTSEAERDAWIKERSDHYRAKAVETLGKVTKAAGGIKVDITKLDI